MIRSPSASTRNAACPYQVIRMGHARGRRWWMVGEVITLIPAPTRGGKPASPPTPPQGERPMSSRRQFLAAAGASAATLGLRPPARADESPEARDKTWLTYAVN